MTPTGGKTAYRSGVELRGMGGMVLWGAPSSLLIATVGMAGVQSTNAWGLVTLVFGVMAYGLIPAAIVWMFGGLLFAIPLWVVLDRLGLTTCNMAVKAPILGALIVGSIWAALAGEWTLSLHLPTWGLAGAISGALGGFGFHRGTAAMRAPA